jgi:hypothetical protein
MGRPLNKKYFGNRNIGTTGTGDNYGIGGEGLDVFTLAVQKGSLIINATYSQPALQIPAPDLPTGVQATAVVVWEVESVAVAAPALNGHGYTTTTGGATTLTGLTGPTFNITAVGSGQGEVQTIVPVNRGSFTEVPVVATTYQVVGGDGGNQVTVKYRVKSITTSEKGSGYTSVPTISWSTAGTNTGGTAVGAPTVTLTADSGFVGSVTNQENAIIAYAYIGGSRQIVDIVKQSGSRRYTVRGADGIVYRAKLKDTADSSAAGEMDIYAYDSAGNTYYVNKLTERRAYLTRKSGGSNYVYASGTSAPWSFADATGIYVKINNA